MTLKDLTERCETADGGRDFALEGLRRGYALAGYMDDEWRCCDVMMNALSQGIHEGMSERELADQYGVRLYDAAAEEAQAHIAAQQAEQPDAFHVEESELRVLYSELLAAGIGLEAYTEWRNALNATQGGAA